MNRTRMHRSFRHVFASAVPVLGLVACGATTTVEQPSAPGSVGAAGESMPATSFPEQAKRLALAAAAEAHESPLDGVTVVSLPREDYPGLLWQTEGGGLCMIDATSTNTYSRQCESPADVSKAPAPGLHALFSGRISSDRSMTAIFLASAETVDGLTCGEREYQVSKVAEYKIGGIARTIYSVTLPDSRNGTYRARVQRNGAVTSDSLDLGASPEFQC